MTDHFLAPGGAVYNASAMRRLRRLVAYAHGLSAGAAELGERRRSLLDERRRTERAIRDVESELPGGERPGTFVLREHGDTRERVDRYAADLRRALEREQERLRLIGDELEQLSRREQLETPVRSAVSEFANALCGVAGFDQHSIAENGLQPATMLVAGDARRAQLDRLQGDIAIARAELNATVNARRPPEEVRAAVDRNLRSFVASTRPDVLLDRFARGDVGVLATATSDTLGLQRQLALLLEVVGLDTVAERITARAIVSERYRPGLAAAERAERVREIEQQIAKLARAEERAALALEDKHEGTLVVRRSAAELDLRMILTLWSAA